METVIEKTKARGMKLSSFDLEQLYVEAFPAVAKWISKSGGSLEDAKDVFHDAMVVYYEKHQALALQSSPSAYLMGICKHLWFRQCRAKNSIEMSLDGIDIPIPQEPTPNQITLLTLLKETGQKCLNILRKFYYQGYSMAELAKAQDFKSERSATVQKYKCLEKIRNEVKSKRLNYEDFLGGN